MLLTLTFGPTATPEPPLLPHAQHRPSVPAQPPPPPPRRPPSHSAPPRRVFPNSTSAIPPLAAIHVSTPRFRA
eukprot:6051238-Prymnesium_polylepis.1